MAEATAAAHTQTAGSAPRRQATTEIPDEPAAPSGEASAEPPQGDPRELPLVGEASAGWLPGAGEIRAGASPVSGGAPVGTMTLRETPPAGFWDLVDDPADGLYLSRLAVDRRFAGRGLGAWLLDAAGGEAAALGKAWLRLDAWKTNTRLHAYYRRQGFRLVGTVEVAGHGSGALFQRPAGEVSPR